MRIDQWLVAISCVLFFIAFCLGAVVVAARFYLAFRK